MKFLILYLLMTLAVVFALPTNMEKRGDIKMPKSTCQPSTLTWSIRNLNSGKPQESFQLVVRNTYVGRIPFRSMKNRQNISSGDNRFSVNHGTYSRNEPLTLTYQGTRYNFNSISHGTTLNSDDGDDIVGKEYQYWFCIK